jgi:hypothetical protein
MCPPALLTCHNSLLQWNPWSGSIGDSLQGSSLTLSNLLSQTPSPAPDAAAAAAPTLSPVPNGAISAAPTLPQSCFDSAPPGGFTCQQQVS